MLVTFSSNFTFTFLRYLLLLEKKGRSLRGPRLGVLKEGIGVCDEFVEKVTSMT